MVKLFFKDSIIPFQYVAFHRQNKNDGTDFLKMTDCGCEIQSSHSNEYEDIIFLDATPCSMTDGHKCCFSRTLLFHRMEAAGSSETLVSIFQTTKHHIPESHYSAYVDHITNTSTAENEEHQTTVNCEQAVILNTQLCML